MTLLEKLAITIIRLRKEKGMSQEVFAYKNHLPRHYLSDIENAKRNPSLEYIERIAKGLGMSAGKLITTAEKVKEQKEE